MSAWADPEAELRRMRTTRPPYYAEALDFPKLWEEYPPPPTYFDTVYRMPREQLLELQRRRLRQQLERAAQIPFYRRLWTQAGVDHREVRGPEDLAYLPTFTVHDIRASIEREPPFGDFMGFTPNDGQPVVLQTSGGTTGLPRPMLYSPIDREVMAILGARRFVMHGVRPGDLVQVTRSLGLPNGGMHVREALWKYTGAVPVMTGSGNITPTRRQIEILRAWGSSVIVGFPAYLRHMAQVAVEEYGIDPRELNVRSLDSNLGAENRAEIERVWGAPCHDFYGAHEAGMMAADCVYQAGMHIQEDAFIVEILDPETNQPVPPGQIGNVCVTSLFKHSAPLIRYNISDLSSIDEGVCECGSTLRRLTGIKGRSDNMVKLRGVNVFPDAIGALVLEDSRTNGEYLCVVERVGSDGRDRMVVRIEEARPGTDRVALARDMERRLHEALMVRIDVEVVDRGALNDITGVTQVSKVKRLLDLRK